MSIEDDLELIGLSSNEAKIYYTLIKMGPSSAIRLSTASGINRRSVYDALEALISHGLVTYQIVDRKKLFSSTNLDSLSALLDEKRIIVDSLQEELHKFFVKKPAEPIIEIFSGKKSMRGVLESQLKIKSTYYIYGGSMQARKLLEIYYKQWTKKRVKAKIKIKGLFTDSPEVKEYVKTLPLIEFKFIPKEILSPAFWWLHGNKVYHVFFQENPIIIAIESKELAKTYLDSFNLLWKKL